MDGSSPEYWKQAVDAKQRENIRQAEEGREKHQMLMEKGEVIREILKSMGIKKSYGTPIRKLPAHCLGYLYPHKDNMMAARDSGVFRSFDVQVIEGGGGHGSTWGPEVTLTGIDEYGTEHTVVHVKIS